MRGWAEDDESEPRCPPPADSSSQVTYDAARKESRLPPDPSFTTVPFCSGLDYGYASSGITGTSPIEVPGGVVIVGTFILRSCLQKVVLAIIYRQGARRYKGKGEFGVRA